MAAALHEASADVSITSTCPSTARPALPWPASLDVALRYVWGQVTSGSVRTVLETALMTHRRHWLPHRNAFCSAKSVIIFQAALACRSGISSRRHVNDNCVELSQHFGADDRLIWQFVRWLIPWPTLRYFVTQSMRNQLAYFFAL